jgi:hypothetical protein
MDQNSTSDAYTDKETAKRRDAALRRALNTPPQPKHGKVRESNPTKAGHPAPAAKRGKRGRVASGS